LFLLFFQVFTFNYYSRDQVKYLFVGFFSALILWKFLLYYTFLWYRKLGYNYRNVIIVGNNATAHELKNYFNTNIWTGYRFKGFFTHDVSAGSSNTDNYDIMEDFVSDNKIDEIYIMSNDVNPRVYEIISSILSKYPVKIRLVPDLSNFSYRNIEFVEYDRVPVMKIKQGPLNFWYNRSVKRLMDIFISTFVIVFILSWLIPLLFVIDLMSDAAGVFFVQKRSGIDNNDFNLFKFRTMKKNGEAHLKQATENDHRITKVGKFLRKTSLDELPQFINVLIGDMSVIGPRPHMLKHTEEYKNMVSKFMIRHAIKPGLTGYAQVNGHRGEIKKTADIENRIKMDVYYIENWSFWLDIKIVFLTILNMLKGDEKAY
ncbi:exopolysaccharide biosynthesis polyprenyl glycosylphosphotransferase, partial [Mariniphaga sediminis]|uniref:exopolysaccharide biosynthesis polyprenyl glycosylphosphotransferase n=1 Tax=Mariniphaga sediminis TaxID=1628158 RepID=UPI0035665243